MRAILFFLFLLVMSIVPAFADEGDANTRYHDAYVLEVVEGKTAEAAKVYLALIHDESAPKRLRLESRFRFAVCAVLLGRSDEARAHLDALLGMADLPQTMRARAERYRKSITGIGLGSELDKKLQELVFELAKSGHKQAQPVYREFEVIGAAALPFLRKLLVHQDASLRTHAFRLLLRMKEPGMEEKWQPHMWMSGTYGVQQYLQRYFKHFEGSRQRFESHVLKLGKPAIEAMDKAWDLSTMSADFIAAFVERGGNKALASRWAARSGTPEGDALLLAWSTDESVEVRYHLYGEVARHGAERPIAEKLFASAIDNCVSEAFRKRGWRLDLSNWSMNVSLAALLNGLERLSRAEREPQGTWSQVAKGLERHQLNPGQVTRLLAMTRERVRKLRRKGALNLTDRTDIHAVLRPHLARAPSDELVAMAQLAFETTVDHSEAVQWAGFFANLDGRGSEGLIAATRIAPPNHRYQFLHRMTADGLSKAELDVTLGMLPTLPWDDNHDVVRSISEIAKSRSDDEGRAIVARAFTASTKIDPSSRRKVQVALIGKYRDSEYLARFGVPLVEARWTDLDPVLRNEVLSEVISAIRKKDASNEHKDSLRAFLRRHLAELRQHHVSSIGSEGDGVLPFATWIPLAPYDWVANYQASGQASATISRIPKEQRDALMEEMVARSKLTRAIVYFGMFRSSTPERGTAYSDRFLALEDRTLRTFVIDRLGTSGTPASPEALQRTLAAMLDESEPMWNDMSKLLLALVRVRPTPQLLPYVKRFLESKDRNAVLNGIAAAGNLGSETLTSALGELLHSMDSEIRRNAKTTMDEINALVKVRGFK